MYSITIGVMQLRYEIKCGDNAELLTELKDNTVDACITDPPYGMGMEHWDKTVPPVEIWKEVLRVLKPGAFCLSFCSPQLYHRMAVNIEDAGFNIQDQIMWMVTTKMPKKNRLKPAHEPIAVAQKPFKGSIEFNAEKWKGVGSINISRKEIPWEGKPPTGWIKGGEGRRAWGKDVKKAGKDAKKKLGTVDANPEGRYPSNIIGEVEPEHQKYFYAPRATRKERGKYNDHPTPKPIELMRYLIRVYSPEKSTILDPYNGSGITGIAALLENRKYIGMELDSHYCNVSEKRIKEHFPLGA